MNLSRGYNLGDATLVQLQVFDWLADHGGAVNGRLIDLHDLFTEQDESDALLIAAALEALANQGLVHLDKALDWASWSCEVSPTGVELVHDLREKRGNPLARRKA